MREQADSPYRAPVHPHVPDHAGEHRPDAVYWTPADPTIGVLVSAWSNQTHRGFRPEYDSVRRRIVGSVIVGGMAALVAGTLFSHFGVLVGLMAAPTAALAAVAMFLIADRARPWCSYVGEDGAAEHRVKVSGARHRLLRFQDAAALFIARTDHIENGFYRRTTVEYSWRNRAGDVLLSDTLTSAERGLAAVGARLGARLAGRVLEDPLSAWLHAAERQWLAHRQAQLQTELAEHGVASFPLSSGGTLSVRRGGIEVAAPRSRNVLATADLGETSWHGGLLILRRRGGRDKDPIQLFAAEIGDLSLALAAMREIAGIDAAARSAE